MLDKSVGSQKRKPSHGSSKKQIVPILDMKKVSLKSIQNVMKRKSFAIKPYRKTNLPQG